MFRTVAGARPGRSAAVGATAVGLAAVLALAGCGGDGGSGGSSKAGSSASVSAPSGSRNDTDVAFASTMIPHAVQALASTQLASSRASSPQIKQVATTISAGQVPQIETLSAWLVSWGLPVPGGPKTTSGGAAISQADLDALSKASGAQFDELWLTTMIRHQQISMVLAQTEVTKGSNAGIKAMAQKMLDERNAQVTTMQGLLKGK